MSLSAEKIRHIINLPEGVDLSFSGVALHSQEVEPGFLFIAIPGNSVHGKNYVEEAVRRGAAGIVAEEKVCQQVRLAYPHLAICSAPHVRKAASALASLAYPERPSFIAAVTGTNGKSSVVGFAQQLWGKIGKKSASLGTLGLQKNFIHAPALPALTTPDAISLHRCLQWLKADQKVDCLALEAASHGLDQYRLDGLRFQVGVFTNFTQDHLDYHETLPVYFQAKCRLFKNLVASQGIMLLAGVLKDNKILRQLSQEKALQLWTYGEGGETLRCTHKSLEKEGQYLKLEMWGQSYSTFLPLLGHFQVENVLAAVGIVVASGINIKEVLEAIPYLEGIPGRLECISHSHKTVYVDYAHKPDALRSVLQAVRPHTVGKLGLVFGCGGNRDASKRQIMGHIAQTYADWVVVTDDNPRNEDPDSIRQAILQTCPEASDIGDRHQAIAEAIRRLEPEDVLIVAGRGAESGQAIGEKIFPFDDRHVVQKLLQSLALQDSF